MIKIGLVEDEQIIRDNLALFFSSIPTFEVAFSHANMEDSLSEPLLHHIDILLLDIGLPGMTGLEGIRPIKQKSPDVKVVMLTAFEDSDRIFKALCAGAVSYISKKTPLKRIEQGLYTIHQGGAYMSPVIAKKVIDYFTPKTDTVFEKLTPRQMQIVQGLVDGLSYKLLADKLMISIETVRDHIKHIYRKLEVNSRTEVIKKYQNFQK